MSTEVPLEPIGRLTPTIGLEEAAQLLRCHPDTVRKMAKAGELPGTKVGRSWVFYTETLLEWLQARVKAGQLRRDDPMHPGGSALVAALDAQLARQTARRRPGDTGRRS